VKKCKYLRRKVTVENYIHEEIKSIFCLGSAFYHLIPSTCNPKTNIKIFSFYGCETWSYSLREENRFKIFEKKKGAEENIWTKKQEMRRNWCKQPAEERTNLCASPIVVIIVVGGSGLCSVQPLCN